MRNKIKTHIEDERLDIETSIIDQIEATLGKFDDRIRGMEIHLFDENGDKGGEDKVCKIDLKLSGIGQYHVRAKHEKYQTCILRAIHKIDSIIAKAIDRNSQKNRIRHQHGGLRQSTIDVVEKST